MALKTLLIFGGTPFPRAVKDRGHATFAGASPIFRARASLVQTGCPSATVVLDCTPPGILGFFARCAKSNELCGSRTN